MRQLFAYGTLMHNFERNNVLTDHGAKLVGPARVNGTLVSLGAYPGAVKGGNHTIKGELWSVPDHVWDLLDEIEGSQYRREPTTVWADSGDERAEVYWFVDLPDNLPRVPEGDWRAYVTQDYGVARWPRVR